MVHCTFSDTNLENNICLSKMKYSQTCVKRPYRTRHVLAFQTGGRLLLNESSAGSSAGAFCPTFIQQ